MSIPIDKIARVCHEANRAYCTIIKDHTIPPGRPWDSETDEQRASVIAGVQAIEDNTALTPERSHQKWLEWKMSNGWVYGNVKDEKKKEHPNLLTWARLPIQEKAKDVLFQAVVRALLQ